MRQAAHSLVDPTVNDETIQRRAKATTENITMSFSDDYMKANAEFRSNAGLKCYITRVSTGECCPWCDSVAGRYEYGEEVDGIYQRHDNCKCSVTYENGRTRQDVWSKKSWEAPETDKTEYKPQVLSREQSKALEAQNMRFKGIDKSGGSGIIEVDKDTLKKYIGKPITQADSQHVREWYYANVTDIPNQIDKTKPFEEQVKQAFELRNYYKHEARVAMSDKKTAMMLDEKRPAPTFEKLLKDKMKRKHMTKDEALKDILETASKTNDEVNKNYGL